MKIKLLLFLLISSAITSFAGITVKKPVKTHPSSVAIFVDQLTYDKTGGAVDIYRAAIENDGLSAYILINDWKNPDEIKSEVIKLYNGKPKLEGIVLIGDIPIPMIRGAQHMTSAFKLDESKPWFESSVPSDRFYDDIDLKFNYIKQDSVHKLAFYYQLDPSSPQRIDRDLYSGRIKPSVDDDTKYETIKKYLLRVSELKKQQNTVDNMFVFTGHGYNSEALTAWTDEQLALREQLPQLFKQGNRLKHLNYRMSREMKEILMTELQDPKLDIALFHAHGAEDLQYLISYPTFDAIDGQTESIKLFLRSKLRAAKRRSQNIEEAKQYYIKKYNLNDKWFEGAFSDSSIKADSLLEYSLDMHIEDVRGISPQARLVIFDECFNGSFHVSPYIAGEYVFGSGNTVAGIGNTTNALQDQWIDEHLGILSYGARFGQWHKTDNLLESHLIGDPTYHFTSYKNENAAALLAAGSQTPEKWKKYLTSEDVALRKMAVCMLYGSHAAKDDKPLANIYRTDGSYNVRMLALKYLAEINSPLFHEVLKEAINDPYELIRRISAHWMGLIAKKEFLPILAKAMLTDESDRVSFNAKGTIIFTDPVLAYEECARQIDLMPSNVSKEKLKKDIKFSFNRSEEWLNKELLPIVLSDTVKLKLRLREVKTFRNYNFISAVPALIGLAKNQKENTDLRKAVLEALGWYALANNKGVIIEACDEILKNTDNPKEVMDEALKTKNRLKEGYSNLITS